MDNIERRNASARPIFGSCFSSSSALVMSLTVGSDATSQCETRSERAPAHSNFDALASRQHDKRAMLYAFDLLAGDGMDLRP
jgi:hypothetical protein